jgi:hypothetical protein
MRGAFDALEHLLSLLHLCFALNPSQYLLLSGLGREVQYIERVTCQGFR